MGQVVSVVAGGIGFVRDHLVSIAFLPHDLIADALQLRQLPPNKRSDENYFLKDNYAPVEKEVESELLEVIGKIPADLSGAFMRVGPNPQFIPKGGYHWFDGDGMVHTVRFRDGKAVYANRFVQTDRLKLERRVGRDLFPRLGSMWGLVGLSRIIADKFKRLALWTPGRLPNATSNTALLFHQKKFFSLVENAFPAVLRLPKTKSGSLLPSDAAIQTVAVDYRFDEGNASLTGTSFTAHPKVCAYTNELFSFGYTIESAAMNYHHIDAVGKVVTSFKVPLKRPVMSHDMSLTERYAILHDFPLVFDPLHPEAKGVGKAPFWFDDAAPMRFGLIPRGSKDVHAVRWIEMNNGYSFHSVAAWDSNNATEVTLLLCRSDRMTLSEISPADGNNQKSWPYIHEYKFDLVTNKHSERRICSVPCEFPVVNENVKGPVRFVWAASFTVLPEWDSVIKVDLTAPGTVKKISHGPGRTGGECRFVPRPNGTTEDAGYLVTFVYDSATKRSECVVYDAETMSPEPLVRLVLPQRVPYGFHGLWTDEKKIV